MITPVKNYSHSHKGFNPIPMSFSHTRIFQIVNKGQGTPKSVNFHPSCIDDIPSFVLKLARESVEIPLQ